MTGFRADFKWKHFRARHVMYAYEKRKTAWIAPVVNKYQKGSKSVGRMEYYIYSSAFYNFGNTFL